MPVRSRSKSAKRTSKKARTNVTQVIKVVAPRKQKKGRQPSEGRRQTGVGFGREWAQSYARATNQTRLGMRRKKSILEQNYNLMQRKIMPNYYAVDQVVPQAAGDVPMAPAYTPWEEELQKLNEFFKARDTFADTAKLKKKDKKMTKEMGVSPMEAMEVEKPVVRPAGVSIGVGTEKVKMKDTGVGPIRNVTREQEIQTPFWPIETMIERVAKRNGKNILTGRGSSVLIATPQAESVPSVQPSIKPEPLDPISPLQPIPISAFQLAQAQQADQILQAMLNAANANYAATSNQPLVLPAIVPSPAVVAPLSIQSVGSLPATSVSSSLSSQSSFSSGDKSIQSFAIVPPPAVVAPLSIQSAGSLPAASVSSSSSSSRGQSVGSLPAASVSSSLSSQSSSSSGDKSIQSFALVPSAAAASSAPSVSLSSIPVVAPLPSSLESFERYGSAPREVLSNSSERFSPLLEYGSGSGSFGSFDISGEFWPNLPSDILSNVFNERYSPSVLTPRQSQSPRSSPLPELPAVPVPMPSELTGVTFASKEQPIRRMGAILADELRASRASMIPSGQIVLPQLVLPQMIQPSQSKYKRGPLRGRRPFSSSPYARGGELKPIRKPFVQVSSSASSESMSVNRSSEGSVSGSTDSMEGTGINEAEEAEKMRLEMEERARLMPKGDRAALRLMEATQGIEEKMRREIEQMPEGEKKKKAQAQFERDLKKGRELTEKAGHGTKEQLADFEKRQAEIVQQMREAEGRKDVEADQKLDSNAIQVQQKVDETVKPVNVLIARPKRSIVQPLPVLEPLPLPPSVEQATPPSAVELNQPVPEAFRELVPSTITGLLERATKPLTEMLRGSVSLRPPPSMFEMLSNAAASLGKLVDPDEDLAPPIDPGAPEIVNPVAEAAEEAAGEDDIEQGGGASAAEEKNVSEVAQENPNQEAEYGNILLSMKKARPRDSTGLRRRQGKQKIKKE